MKLFWEYDITYADEAGYELFGLKHISLLSVCFIVLVIFIFLMKRGSLAFRHRAMKIVGLSPLALIVIRDIYVTIEGHMGKYELPLHLCSIAGILCGVHFFSRKKWLGQVLYALCMPGALSAMLFPDAPYYPIFHFLTIESFLFHLLILMYVFGAIVEGEIVPSVKKSYQCFIFIGILGPLMLLFDTIFGVNYMYLKVPPPDSPVDWIESYMGNPGYLAGFAILAAVIIVVVNAIGELVLYTLSRNAKRG